MLNNNNKRNISLNEIEDDLSIKKICEGIVDPQDSLDSSNSVDFDTSELTEDTQFNFFKSNSADMKKITILNSTANVPNYNNIVIYDNPGPSDDSMNGNRGLSDQMIHEMESTGDLKKDLAGIFDLLKSIKLDNRETNGKLVKLTESVVNNTENIVILNDNINLQQKQILKNTENVNFIKQSQIDKEVFVAGIPTTTDDQFVMDELIKFYEFQLDSVLSYKAITVTTKTPQKIINIKFTTKDNQIAFLTLVKTKGPFFTKKLVSEADPSKKIAIKRRLTQENRDVNVRLQKLLENNKIHKVRYRNCFYEYQLSASSKFVAVPSIQHMDFFNLK